jgi:7,8-dihydropterin-6-yl-methyl-4-(beta-D-ribofuranosyl)aminobenzene 5'-phosphate synthase
LTVKLVVLDDNVGSPGLLNEWGWSVYIEANGLKVLFDADTSPEVIEHNSAKLNVPLAQLDFAVLSHHHSDHYGGFPAVARAKPGLRVYVPPGYVDWARGLPLDITVVRGPSRLAEGFYSSGPLSAYGLYEQALAVQVGGEGILVIVGCSHPGADRLAERLREFTGMDVIAVIGGYHSPPVEVLDRLAEMSRYVCPAHCSGEHAKQYVKRRYPEKYCEVRTGSTVIVGNDGTIEVQHPH